MRLVALLFCISYACAQAGPQPPCGVDAVPIYPSLDSPPVARFWSESSLGRDWKPPACTAWNSIGFSTLTTVSARFHYDGGSEGLLRKIGAVSGFANIHYWSATHKQWQTLITDSFAVAGTSSQQHRADFTSDEI